MLNLEIRLTWLIFIDVWDLSWRTLLFFLLRQILLLDGRNRLCLYKLGRAATIVHLSQHSNTISGPNGITFALAVLWRVVSMLSSIRKLINFLFFLSNLCKNLFLVEDLWYFLVGRAHVAISGFLSYYLFSHWMSFSVGMG